MPDNLPELRDIHLPEGVSAFPPAYGWWVILAIILGGIALFYLFRVLRAASKKLYARHLLKRLSGLDTVSAAVGMSEVLRRICVVKYPEAAALSGQDWLDFLNDHSRLKLSGAAAELLLNAPYMPKSEKRFNAADADGLRNFCQSWIGENL